MFLMVEYNGNNFKRLWKLPLSQKPLSVGHSRLATIRLDGDHPGIEGAFEFKEGQWIFTDLSSVSSTKTNRIIAIQGCTEIPLKTGHLRVLPVKKEILLFEKKSHGEGSSSAKTKSTHLWLIWKRNGSVWYSEFLEKPHSITWPHNRESIQIHPTNDWQTVNNENFELQYKLIGASEGSSVPQNRWESFVDRELRPYMLSALTLSLLIGSLTFFKESPLKTEGRAPPRPPLQSTLIRLEKKPVAPSRNAVSQALAKVTAPSSNQGTSKSPRRGLSGVFSQISKRATASINMGSKTITLSESVTAPMPSPQAKTFKMLGALGNGTGLKGQGTSRGIAAAGTSSLGGPIGGSQLGQMNQGSIGQPDLGLLHKEAEVSGGLDREVIAKYIQSQKGKILYCYQRQLSANPGLFGKIAVKFQIDPKGLVESSSIIENTLDNKNVENCLLQLMTGWRFPEPKGGVRVLVNYPFVFKSLN